ncbi:MAG TPA: CHASE3 domain-containing protein [Methylocella sp.]|nr:CHASE3 domain-containing protein [Methylocella sp.]
MSFARKSDHRFRPIEAAAAAIRHLFSFPQVEGLRLPRRAVTQAIGSGTLLILAAAAAIFASISAPEAERWVAHTYEVKDEAALLVRTLVDAEEGVWAYSLTGKVEYRERSKGVCEDANCALKKLRSLTSDNPSQQLRLDALSPLVDRKFAFMGHVISVGEGGSRQDALALVQNGEGLSLMETIRGKIADFESEEDRLLAIREQTAAVARHWLLGLALASLAGAVLSFGAFFKGIALAHAVQYLYIANERLTQFAFVAAHDLQEPLRKIVSFSKLQREAFATSNVEEVVHASNVIQASALRARQLVDDLLAFCRTINDPQQLQDLDMREEIECALNILSAAINETGSEITVDAPHLGFRADRIQFERLIQNLVSNAIKYRKPDLPAKVHISARLIDKNAARIAIADNGIGIEPQYAIVIFEPFKRLHSKSSYPGTGIGLAICKSIADRHGWELSVDSQLGQGTTFFITIPRSATL